MDLDFYHLSAFRNHHLGLSKDSEITVRVIETNIPYLHLTGSFYYHTVFFSPCVASMSSTGHHFLHGRREGEKMFVDSQVVVDLLEFRSEFHANIVPIQA